MNRTFAKTLLFAVVVAGAWCSSAAASRRPNILVAIADDWSYGHAGAYGCSWVDTPAFDRIAREGTLFDRAYTPNAKCAPSRACLLTGRNPWRLEAAVNHFPFFPSKYQTYPEALSRNGYAVGHTGKGWAPGVAKDAAGNQRQLAGQRYASRTWDPPADGISPIDYAANFVDFINQAGARPWCFWYGALEPHRAYEAGVGRRLAGKRLDAVDRVPAYWPDNNTVRSDMLDYAYEVEHFDRHLGRMLDELTKRGVLDNTLVLVTSDHGMPFPRCKGQAYDASNRVPLAVRWPHGRVQSGRRLSTLVSLVDVAPTIGELSQTDWTRAGMAPADGRSLLPLLRGENETHRSHVLLGKERHDVGRPGDAGYAIRGIVTKQWLYLRNFNSTRWPAGNPETGYLNCDASPTKTHLLDRRDRTVSDRFWRLAFDLRPAEELYNLEGDPDCVANLAEDSGAAVTKRELGERMTVELTRENDPRTLGHERQIESYPYSDPKHRGYYEKWRKGKVGVAGWVLASDYRRSQNPDLPGTDNPSADTPREPARKENP